MPAESDWASFEKALESVADGLDRRGPRPHPRALDLAKSDFYGSSENFNIELSLYYSHLLVPERRIVPLLGLPGNTTHIGPPPEPGTVCPHCGDRPLEAIDESDDPSILYCIRCHKSGYDYRLSQQRSIARNPTATNGAPKTRKKGRRPAGTAQP